VPTALNDATGDADFKNATDAAAGVCCDSQLLADCNAVATAATGETAGETKKGETAGETKKEEKKGETKKETKKDDKKAAGES